jgi:type II secretory pathway component PulF
MPDRHGMNTRRAHARMSRRQCRQAVTRWNTLLAAGLAAGEALQIGATAGGTCSQLLARTARSVARGRPVWLSMSRGGFALTSAELALVRAGETSGRLRETLTLLGRLLEREASERGRLWQAALYPIGLLAVTTAVVCTLATWVLPSFADMYADAGSQLPISTRLMIRAADLLLSKGYLLAIAATALAASWLAARRAWRRFAEATDRLTLSIPIAGTLVRCTQRAKLYALLAAMVGAGVDVESALALALPAVSNRYLRAECDRMRTLVHNGEALSDAVRKSGFDSYGTDSGLLRVAEATGGYADAFGRLARVYDGERDVLASRLLAAVEPGAVAIMATIIGATVLAVYQPVLGSATLLTKTLP